VKVDTVRAGGNTVLRVTGRIDREWAEHLSDALEDLLRKGVRSLSVDLSGVEYISSAGADVLVRHAQALSGIRGELRLSSPSPAVLEAFSVIGQDHRLRSDSDRGAAQLRQTIWDLQATVQTAGTYQTSSCASEGSLICRLHGDPSRLRRMPYGQEDCEVVAFPSTAFGLGIGGIGSRYEGCASRLGELVAVGGCVAYLPTEGAPVADYLIGNGPSSARAVLASGISCEGAFSHLVRFDTRLEGPAAGLAELVQSGLKATGAKSAGLVIAAEAAGLVGAALRRSPGIAGGPPLSFDVAAAREWLSFSHEWTHIGTTVLIVGVATRRPEQPLAVHLRPLDRAARLHGHFHALVFSYHPLPQRTVELKSLVTALFQGCRLRTVMHLLSDDRGQAGVGENKFLRGVAWVSPIGRVEPAS
jgi:anti-anti-sigma factor